MKKCTYFLIVITLLFSLILTAFPAQEAQSLVIPDTLTIYGTDLDNVIIVTDTTIDVDGNVIIYSGIDLIVVNGFAGNDLLVADLTGAIVSTPITFNGGDNNDTLQIQGDPGLLIDSINYTPGPANDAGQIISSGSPSLNITFTGLEPVIDLVPVATLTVNATGSPNTINYLAGSVATQGLVSIDAYETIEFGNKTNLVINAMDAADTININNPSAGFPTSLTVNGDGGIDTTNVNNDINLAANLDIVINTEAINFAGSTIQTLGTGIQDFNGPMTLNGDTTFSMEANCDFDNPIGGGFGLIKDGSGVLTLSAGNSYTGTTTVNNGILLVTGSTAGSSTVIVNAGTLGGTGSLNGPVNVTATGIFAPGISPGCINTGNLTMTAGSVLSVEINGATVCTQYDQIDVTGTVNLGGATLNLIGGFAATPGTELIIINNDAADAVTGTFSGLPQGSVITLGAFLGRISYMGGDGNDVSLTAVGIDYGDAPDPTYPTLIATNGASHILGTNVYLGTSVDTEADGQQTPNADGDDLNGSTPDDEDGVVFTSLLVPATTATVDVTASIGSLLNAWIDFNRNGIWDHPAEAIFTDQALGAGLNNLSFAVPASAGTGTTYARFRVDSGGGLVPTGGASDGEVEDYQVNIIASASIGDRVWYDADADGIQDPGELGLAGVVVHLISAGTIIDTTATNASGSYSFTNLFPGDYQLDFIPPTGHAFTWKDQGADDAVDNDDDHWSITDLTTLSPGETDNTWDAGMWDLEGMDGESSNSAGTGKVLFFTNETVYAIGSKFFPGSTIDVIVVPAQTWNNNDPIPPDITDSGATPAVVAANGNILPLPVWSPPLAVGTYNIIFDFDRDGIFNSSFEIPDPIGFFEVREPIYTGGGPTVGGEVMLVNKVQLVNQLISLPMCLMMEFVL